MSGTTAHRAPQTHRLQPFPVSVGLAVGFGISTFGLALPWAAAALAVGAGLLVRSRRALFAQLGLGLVGGAVAYIGLGLVQQLFDAPSADSGGS